MPGYNGTGPAGMGAMTGGGRGNCRAGNARGYAGSGCGFGRRFGRKGGYGFQRGPRYFQNDGIAYPLQALSKEEELAMLKAEAERARNVLDAIRKKMDAIETSEEA